MKIAKNSGKLKIGFRRIFEGRKQWISGQQARTLRFYQFKSATAAFFTERLGRTDVRIEDTPHYHFAVALLRNEGIEKAERYYADYLTASWGEKRSSEFATRIEKFKSHLTAAQSDAPMPTPVVSYFSSIDQPFVLDGNHRFSFAAAMDRSVRTEVLPADLSLLLFSKAKEFYGTGYRDMPYQSVFLNGEEVVRGRRNDAAERIRLIPPRAIEGLSVVDVASNIGMSSLFAKRAGAEECLGLEISPGMIDLSTRFAMFEGLFPKVRFTQFNVDSDSLPENEMFDTAFMFSIHDHLKRPENLITIARNNVRKFVVFEGHPNATKSNYAGFFESGLFKSIEEIGALSESRFNKLKNRPLWLCEK